MSSKPFYCYCWLLLPLATCYLCTKRSWTQAPTADGRYLLLLLVNRLTSNKSTCRQQNTLPLKDELVARIARKDAKSYFWNRQKKLLSSEVLLPLLAATATCYKLPLHQFAAADNRMPYLLRPTSEPHQLLKHLPTAKHPASEGRSSFWITTKRTCRQQNTMPLSSEVLLLLLAATATCYLLLVHHNAVADNRMPYLLLLLVNRTSNKSTCRLQNTLLLDGRTSARITTKSTCRQQNTMPLKDEQVPELHGKMPNVTSETLLKLRVPTSYLWTARSRTKAPKADSKTLLLPLEETNLPPKAPADSKTPCHWRTNKSQNCTGKMPNVTSETVEKTIVFGGFTATAGCYCHLLPATCASNAAADNRMPYLLLLLVNRTSNKSTCRQQTALPLKDLNWAARITTKSTCWQQNTMPLKDEQVPEFHGKMPNVTSETLLKFRALLTLTPWQWRIVEAPDSVTANLPTC